MARKSITIWRMPNGRYIGVTDAAKTLGVVKQTIYLYLRGVETSIGPEKRKRVRVVDLKNAEA